MLTNSCSQMSDYICTPPSLLSPEPCTHAELTRAGDHERVLSRMIIHLVLWTAIIFGSQNSLIRQSYTCSNAESSRVITQVGSSLSPPQSQLTRDIQPLAVPRTARTITTHIRDNPNPNNPITPLLLHIFKSSMWRFPSCQSPISFQKLGHRKAQATRRSNKPPLLLRRSSP